MEGEMGKSILIYELVPSGSGPGTGFLHVCGVLHVLWLDRRDNRVEKVENI